jgi:hypothetical protein
MSQACMKGQALLAIKSEQIGSLQSTETFGRHGPALTLLRWLATRNPSGGAYISSSITYSLGPKI